MGNRALCCLRAFGKDGCSAEVGGESGRPQPLPAAAKAPSVRPAWLLHKVTPERVIADCGASGGGAKKDWSSLRKLDPNRHKEALWPGQDKDFADIGADNVAIPLLTQIANGDKDMLQLLGVLQESREATSNLKSMAIAAFFRSYLKDQIVSIKAQLKELRVECPREVTLDFCVSDRPSNGHQSSSYFDTGKMNSDSEQARRSSVASQRSHVSVVLAATATALLRQKGLEEVPNLIASIIERNTEGLEESHEAVQLVRSEARAAEKLSEALSALAKKLDGDYLEQHPFTHEYKELIASVLTIHVTKQAIPSIKDGVAVDRFFLVPVRK